MGEGKCRIKLMMGIANMCRARAGTLRKRQDVNADYLTSGWIDCYGQWSMVNGHG